MGVFLHYLSCETEFLSESAMKSAVVLFYRSLGWQSKNRLPNAAFGPDGDRDLFGQQSGDPPTFAGVL